MSWFGSGNGIDAKIEQATSENLPSGTQDLGLNLEICDLIRSKTVPPKDAMRSLKRRLLHKNPNVQIATLHLIDITIKNGGSHFIAEIASREFMDTFVLVLKPLQGSVNPDVKTLMLDLLQNWARAFEGQIQLSYVNKVYNNLKAEGFQFPVAQGTINSTFFDTSAPPEWVDSDTCMKSGTPFSFVNRKHHCRNCGGVFIQKYCNNYTSLPHFGINEPTRVCDDCFEKLTGKKGFGSDPDGDSSSVNHVASTANTESETAANTKTTAPAPADDEDDLQRAIRLSLEEAERNKAPAAPAFSSQPSIPEEEEDDDMKAAIAASLAEMNGSHSTDLHQETTTGFANNLYQQSANYTAASQPPLSHYSTGSSQQLTGESQAPTTPAEINEFSPLEGEAINRYVQLVDSMDNAPPGAILQNTQLQDLNEKVAQLRPKLAKGLRQTIDKCEKLEDMHGKLTAVARLYDQLLEDRLQYNYRGQTYPQPQGHYQPGAPSAPPAMNPLQSGYSGSYPPVAGPGYGYDQPNAYAQPQRVEENYTGQSAYDSERFQQRYPPAPSYGVADSQHPSASSAQIVEPKPEPKEEPVLIEL